MEHSDQFRRSLLWMLKNEKDHQIRIGGLVQTISFDPRTHRTIVVHKSTVALKLDASSMACPSAHDGGQVSSDLMQEITDGDRLRCF